MGTDGLPDLISDQVSQYWCMTGFLIVKRLIGIWNHFRSQVYASFESNMGHEAESGRSLPRHSNNNGSCAASCPLPQAADLLKKTLTLTSKLEENLVGGPTVKVHGKDETIKQITHNEDQTFPMIPYLASCMSLICIAIMSFLNEVFQIRVKYEKNRKVCTLICSDMVNISIAIYLQSYRCAKLKGWTH